MQKKGGWGKVYQDVTRNRNISAAAKGVYAYLSALCGVSDECYPSVETVTREMGMGKDTFYRHINVLVAAGIVEKHQIVGEDGRFGRTIYRLTHEVTIFEKQGFPCTDNRDTDNADTENKETINNIITKNNIKKNIEYQEIVDLYNSICASFPKLTKLSDKRKKTIRARINQGYSFYDFKRLFELAEGSRFLRGGNDRNWRATFDWMIADANMAKVLDGNYTDRKGGGDDATTGNKSRGSAGDFYKQFLGTGNGDQG